MVILAIIGILAAIAVPNYNDYVVKSRRAAAESFMLSVANLEAQMLLDLRRYVDVANNAAFPNAATAVSPGLNVTVPENVSDYYDLDVDAPVGNPPTFTITAAPKGGQAAADTLCGTLTINQAGTKGKSGTGTVSQCW